MSRNHPRIYTGSSLSSIVTAETEAKKTKKKKEKKKKYEKEIIRKENARNKGPKSSSAAVRERQTTRPLPRAVDVGRAPFVGTPSWECRAHVHMRVLLKKAGFASRKWRSPIRLRGEGRRGKGTMGGETTTTLNRSTPEAEWRGVPRGEGA